MKVLLILLIVLLILCLCLIYWMNLQLSVLRKGNLVKSAFLHKTAYDIRTPLHSVMGLASIVSKEDICLSKEEKKNITRQIFFNTSLINTTLDEIMVLADCGEGHVIENESFAPIELCQHCIELHRKNVNLSSNVQLKFKRDLDSMFFVDSDPHLIELVVNKLLDNAIRFTHKGKIVVGCNITEYKDHITIYVEDTGEGIPENRRKDVFEWFNKPTEVLDDAELDLSIAKRVAEKLGGVLQIDDHYSEGTRMILCLPLK